MTHRAALGRPRRMDRMSQLRHWSGRIDTFDIIALVAIFLRW